MVWKKHVCGFEGFGPVHIALYNLVVMSHAKSSASAPTIPTPAYLNAKCSNIEAFVVSQALHKDVD